jgi:iron complex outermembrane receptor protein
MATAIGDRAHGAEAMVAQNIPEEIPENVLITGSLIRGTVAVGVPVTNLGTQDFKTTGALSTSDLFRSIPQFNVGVGGGAGTIAAGRAEGGTRVNLRQLDTGTAPRNLMMIDGVRFPPQDQGLCQIEPDVIPVVAIDRIDLLLDGASATYGSDAIGGVINVILKRAYDGAVTTGGFKNGGGGNNQYFASQLWGRTWDGGDITLSYEWADTSPLLGNKLRNFQLDFTPWGLTTELPSVRPSRARSRSAIRHSLPRLAWAPEAPMRWAAIAPIAGRFRPARVRPSTAPSTAVSDPRPPSALRR